MNDNINNLTSLWKTVGVRAGKYSEHEYFYRSEVSNAQWPNRIWLKAPVSNDSFKEMKLFVQRSGCPLTVSYWSDFEDKSFQVIERNGLEKKSAQIGMSLDVTGQFKHLNRVELRKIATVKDARLWEGLYVLSFGYIISAETIIRTKEQVDFYLVYLDHKAIGTAIAFKTAETLGIHGMGIIPSYRKQGFAEEVMLNLVNLAFDGGMTRIVLQASGMGKNIYTKIGFQEDFFMTNYRLKQ